MASTDDDEGGSGVVGVEAGCRGNWAWGGCAPGTGCGNRGSGSGSGSGYGYRNGFRTGRVRSCVCAMVAPMKRSDSVDGGARRCGLQSGAQQVDRDHEQGRRGGRQKLLRLRRSASQDGDARSIPTNAAAYYNIGHHLQGRAEVVRRGRRVQRRAQVRRRQSGAALRARQRALRAEQGRPTRRREFEKALKIDPKLYKAHYRLGVVLQAQEKLREADAEYRKAIEANPRFVQAYLKLGDMYLDNDYDKEAAQVFQNAILANDSDGEAHQGSPRRCRSRSSTKRRSRSSRRRVARQRRALPRLLQHRPHLRAARRQEERQGVARQVRQELFGPRRGPSWRRPPATRCTRSTRRNARFRRHAAFASGGFMRTLILVLALALAPSLAYASPLSTAGRPITVSSSRRASARELSRTSARPGHRARRSSRCRRRAGRHLRRLQDQALHLRARLRSVACGEWHQHRQHVDLDVDHLVPVRARRQRRHRPLRRQARRALRPIRHGLRHHRRRRHRHRRERLSSHATTSARAFATGSTRSSPSGRSPASTAASCGTRARRRNGMPSTTSSSGLTSIFAQLQFMGVF